MMRRQLFAAPVMLLRLEKIRREQRLFYSWAEILFLKSLIMTAERMAHFNCSWKETKAFLRYEFKKKMNFGGESFKEDIRRHAQTFKDIRRQSKTFEDIHRHVKTFKDIQKLSKTFEDTQRHLKTFKDIRRH